jgi:hypothetical protein
MTAPCGCCAVTYYSTILAWSLYYLGASFAWPLPWASGCSDDDATCMADPARALPLTKSNAYFTDTVIRFDESKVNDGSATAVSGPVFGCAPLYVALPCRLHIPASPINRQLTLKAEPICCADSSIDRNLRVQKRRQEFHSSILFLATYPEVFRNYHSALFCRVFLDGRRHLNHPMPRCDFVLQSLPKCCLCGVPNSLQSHTSTVLQLRRASYQYESLSW